MPCTTALCPRTGGVCAGRRPWGSFRQADAVKALRLRRPKAEGRESAFPEGRFETEAYAMHNGALPANRRGVRGQAALGGFRQADVVKALRLRRPKAEGWESAFPEGRFETEAYAMHNGALPANRRGLRAKAALGSFRQAVTRWRRCVFFLLRDFCRGDDECGAMSLQYTKSASKISWAARFFAASCVVRL